VKKIAHPAHGSQSEEDEPVRLTACKKKRIFLFLLLGNFFLDSFEEEEASAAKKS